MSKAFCLGVWKTGTTSVGKALNQLIGGYHDGNTDWSDHRALHLKNIVDGNTSKIASLNHLISRYSTFDDNPWNRSMVIEELKNYKKYKYILTTRDPDEWHYSAYSFYRKKMERGELSGFDIWSLYQAEFKWVLGDSVDLTQVVEDDFSGMVKHKSFWVDWFNQRNEKVKGMFKGNLLEYNISDGLGWEPLCNYLGKEIPTKPFPRLNSQN